MSTATADRARILVAESGDRVRRAVPDGSLRALVAGGEAAVLGWLAVVIPAIASYVATATAPALGEATWLQAAIVGSALWRMAHGGLVTLAGGYVTLVPLGVSLLAAALLAWAVRRARVVTWHGLVAAVAGYASVATALASLPETAEGGWGRTAVGAIAVALVGGLAGLRRAAGGWPVAASWIEERRARVPDDLRSVAVAAGRGGLVALGGLASVGAVLVGVSIGVHYDAVADALATLASDRLSTAMVVVAMALYLPTALVWAVAWAAGPGFAVGTGTIVAPSGVSAGALPAVPAFLALPETGTAGSSAAWAPLAIVLVGLLVGWRLHCRDPQPRLWGSVVSAVGAAAVAAVMSLGLAAVARGAIGPGRMVDFGPDPGSVARSVGVWVVLGAIVVVVPARPDAVALVRRLVRRARRTPSAGAASD